MTGAIASNSGQAQILDSLPVEKERGITVKAQSASLLYRFEDGHTYLLNLIDTPGHVDFSNEVTRSLSACEGVILLVDANQGVQAQTVANYHLAIDKGLVVVPVLNKIGKLSLSIMFVTFFHSKCLSPIFFFFQI